MPSIISALFYWQDPGRIQFDVENNSKNFQKLCIHFSDSNSDSVVCRFRKMKFVWICNLTWFRTLHCSLINQFKRLFQVKTANKRSNINKIIGGEAIRKPRVCAYCF